MLRIIMFRKKINTFKAYQIIARLTKGKMMDFSKLTNGSNNICNYIFVNFLLTF